MMHLGTKLVNAYPMTRRDYNDFRGWELPEDEDGDDAGYLVEYLDGGKPNTERFNGYVSWSPEDVFKKAYMPVEGGDLGMALAWARHGFRVARKGWNDKNMWVVFKPGYPDGVPCNLATAAAHGFDQGQTIYYLPYFEMHDAQGNLAPWVPSQSDMVSFDWHVAGEMPA